MFSGQKSEKGIMGKLILPVVACGLFLACTGNFNTAMDSAGTSSASSASPTASLKNTNPCLPMATPSFDDVLNAPKKVFAHYFYPFPLSIDNLPAASDYYTTQYFNLHGESNKFLSNGGYLRQRPLPVAPSTDPHWQLLNMQKEVRLAIARGLNGFAVDTMSITDASSGGPLMMMLQAAQAVDPRFKILLMPDMSAFGSTTAPVETILKAVYNHPSLYRLADGRVALTPFSSETVTPAAWSSLLTSLKNQGLNVAFWPTFGSLTPTFISQYASISVGLGEWAKPGTPDQLSWTLSGATAVRASSAPLLLDGFSPQGYRPKNFVYDEAVNSLAYRNAWTGALQTNPDIVHIATWSDYSETTQISPMTSQYGDSGDGFYNLTGYYAAWYQAGKQPTITHDVLYYFHRKMPTNAAAPNQAQATVTSYPQTPQNQIELLAFLTAPGTLSISIGGQTYTEDAPAGMTSFLAPLGVGTPAFKLTRNGSPVIQFQSKTQIYGAGGMPTGVLDLTYWSGSASTSGVCQISP